MIIYLQSECIETYQLDTVSTNLENLEKSGNLKEVSESQGICDGIPNVREKSEYFVV